MTFALAALTVATPDPAAAAAFYADVFGASPLDALASDGGRLDLRGSGILEIQARETPASGFNGVSPSCILDQPADVETVLARAVAAGATVVSPAKNSLFAGMAAVFRAPDGSVWKLATPKRRNTAEPVEIPSPSEIVVLLGVADVRASKRFYEALSARPDNSYGGKYADFHAAPGAPKLALFPARELVKDVGMDPSADADGPLGVAYAPVSDVDAILKAVGGAGGAVREGGTFADPDGHVWRPTRA